MKKKELKILILEDFAPDIDLICRELNKAKFEFTHQAVDNMDDFIDGVKKFKPDLIISDYSLPQYDGISAIHDLQKISPQTPIIIVTGSLDEETAADTIKSGAWDYVVKERLFRLPSAIKQALKLKAEMHEKEKAEKALHETEHEYETLRKNVPLAIYRSNVDGKLLYVNPAFLDMFGFKSLEEALETPIADYYVDPGQRDVLMKSLIKHSVVKDYEIKLKKKNGVEFWGSFNIRAIFDKEGKHIFQDGIISDITKIKKAHEELVNAKTQAEEADKLKTAFLANMSHEIRTPMNAIIGFADLLNDPNFETEDIGYFTRHIQKNSELLLRIMSDIMDVAKMEAGIIQVDKKKANLHEVLHEIYDTFDKFRKEDDEEIRKDIRFTMKTAKDTSVPLTVNTDHFRIKQILNNLLTNAFKFTEKGEVEFGYNINENNDITLYVKDTGLGIPEEKQEIIFERFRQVDDSHTREFGGTGLGLTIAKTLAEKLGGDMWLKSKLYEGSTFYFTIPYDEKEEPVAVKPKAKVRSKDYNFKKVKILVAEDVESNFLYIDTILKPTGAKIFHARDGEDAIALFKQEQDFDLVLMDIQMPVMNGYEATKEIKKINNNVPVIGQTAYALSTDREKVFAAGCDDYLVKPIHKKALLEIVEKYGG